MKRKEEQFHALLLGGEPGLARTLEETLSEAQRGVFKVHYGSTFQEAQGLLKQEPIDFVFMDLDASIHNPDNAFMELARIATNFPVLVLIESQNDDMAWQAMNRGAQDFLVKNQFDGALLLRTTRHSMLRHKLVRKLNEIVHDSEESASRLKNIQETLTQNGNILGLLLSQLAGVVWTTDLDLRFTSSQGKGLSHLNLAPNQTVGQTLTQYMGTEDEEFLPIKAHRKALRGEQAFYELEWQGTIFETAVGPIKDQSGKIVGTVGVALDITDRKILEGQFRASQKMEAIGRLAGGIAHDFNNLLTVIINYTQLVMSQLSGNEEAISRLNAVANSANRAASLTGQLLAFSRQQAAKGQKMDLNSVLRSLDQMLKRIIGEDIELQMVRGADVGKILADPSQMIHVVMNLAVNARDAMPEGGKLTIETSSEVLDEAFAQKHLGMSAGPCVLLCVSDTGAGMDKETQAHLFEPFTGAKGFDKGNELGLAAISGVVKQSGGQISVYSEVGRGTTFKIYLPESEPAVNAKEEVSRSAEPQKEKGVETILVVEDEDVVRQVACDIIRQGGYRVLEATSAIAALEMCERSKEHIDLILTDLIMPKMNGPELVKRLAGQHPKLGVVFMSGYTNEAATSNGLLSAPAAFVQKPFMPKTLLQVIRQTLDTRIN